MEVKPLFQGEVVDVDVNESRFVLEVESVAPGSEYTFKVDPKVEWQAHGVYVSPGCGEYFAMVGVWVGEDQVIVTTPDLMPCVVFEPSGTDLDLTLTPCVNVDLKVVVRNLSEVPRPFFGWVDGRSVVKPPHATRSTNQYAVFQRTNESGIRAAVRAGHCVRVVAVPVSAAENEERRKHF